MTKLWWGVGGVIVVGLLVWAGNFGLQLYQQWSQQRYIASVEVLKAEYKNDTYGGATPEETLQLFIKAFQAGDLELASKYFIIEKQADALSDMKVIIKNNRKDIVANVMSSYDKKECFEYRKTCEFSKYDEKVGAWSKSSLILNQDTLVWKLVSM